MPTLLSIEALESERLYVQRQLDETLESKWGTARLMWKSRLADIEKKLAELSAARSNYASVALIFDGTPVVGASDIRLDFAADALDKYQKVITLALASKLSEAIPERGRIPGTNQSRLFIRDIARGSMGFILEEIAPEQQEMLPTILKDAVESTTQLITSLSASSDADLDDVLVTVQPRLVGAIQRFAKNLYEAGASTRIVGDELSLALSLEDVGRLSNRLNEIEIKEEIEQLRGVLLGILPEARQFELRLPQDDDATVAGVISEELATKYLADIAFKDRLLLKPVLAQIKLIQTIRNGRLVREQRVLEAVEQATQ